jgi:hypothetical protein
MKKSLALTSKEGKRATGLEPATSSLGSWHSTTELHPRVLVMIEGERE